VKLARGESHHRVVKEKLANGVTLVAERVPTARSVSIGVWVPIGSRDDEELCAGEAHFIEHLVFKGTTTRSALDIAREIDALGGDLNAFTSREMTCYYARVLDEFAPKAIELLADISCNPAFDEKEVETERNVVFEEIRASLDDTASLSHDFFNEAFWQGHPLGRPIAGTLATVASLDRDTLLERFERCYGAGSMVIAAAGNLDFESFKEAVEEFFADLRDAFVAERFPPSRPASLLAVGKRNSEEAHIFLGVEGLKRDDPRRYALLYLNQILGGSTSSRLFQEIREKRGLAYSTYSFFDQYEDAGCFGVYAATSAQRASEVLSVMRDELSKIATGEIEEDEFEVARGHIAGMLVLGDEDTGSKMGRLGRSQIALGEPISLEELLDETAKVTLDDVSDLAKTLLNGSPCTTVVVGPFDRTYGERFIDAEEKFLYSDSPHVCVDDDDQKGPADPVLPQ